MIRTWASTKARALDKLDLALLVAEGGGEAVRRACREGKLRGSTRHVPEAAGLVQANLVAVPRRWARRFYEFCERNQRACPLLDVVAWEPSPRGLASSGSGEEKWGTRLARNADVRTDCPKYRVFRRGSPPTDAFGHDLASEWESNDAVGFLLGCSFSWEQRLLDEGVVDLNDPAGNRNVPMYRTSVPNAASGPFKGNLVVSFRRFSPAHARRAEEITSEYPSAHSAPVHAGDPRGLGITDLARPDFGDAPSLATLGHSVNLFWACGVTPQAALEGAVRSGEVEWAATHAPGCMFVTDVASSAQREHG